MHDVRAGVATHAARRVTWIELFFDLVFVAAVGQVGRPLAEHGGIGALLQYGFLLILIWSAWQGYVGYATRHDPDTPAARACTLLQMVAVVFMAANGEDAIGSESTAGFVAAYGGLRLLLAVQYGTADASARRSTYVRARMYGLLIGGTLWILSAFVPVRSRYMVWGAAAALEVVLEYSTVRASLDRPPHADHLPERFGLFTLILLGEALVSIMHGIQQQPLWSLAAAATALGGLSAVFVVWWAYFDAAAATRARRVRDGADVRALVRWTYAHLPLYLGLALFGVEVETLVRLGGLPAAPATTGPLALSVVLVAAGLGGVASRRSAYT